MSLSVRKSRTISPEFTGVEMEKHKREEETGTLLYYASIGNVPILKHMLDNGTPVDAADYDGRTALHLAASEGHAAAVKLLLDYNPNVNPCDRFNETVSEFHLHGGPLHIHRHMAVSIIILVYRGFSVHVSLY